MNLVNISPSDRFHYINNLSDHEIDKLLPLISPLHTAVIKDNVLTEQRNLNSSNYLISNIKKYLSVLTFIDKFFEHELNYKQHIYLLNDDTLEILVNKNHSYDSMTQNCSNILESMSVLGFIYRFNIASKFGYQDHITQLRLNGWGRLLSEELELPNQEFYNEIKAFWYEKLLIYKDSYLQLFDLCNSIDRPLNIKTIHHINNNLLIKVVT